MATEVTAPSRFPSENPENGKLWTSEIPQIQKSEIRKIQKSGNLGNQMPAEVTAPSRFPKGNQENRKF